VDIFLRGNAALLLDMRVREVFEDFLRRWQERMYMKVKMRT